jgi:outer membrane receptor for ferrienterochelin and colicin
MLTLLIGGGFGVYGQADTSNLEELSLKDLLNVKVITASRTLQELGVVPASVILITQEQIKMRGYQSLLDVIYDLPDVKVDDKIYGAIRNTVTIRGTEGEGKLVILIDGLSISSPSGEAMPIMENYPVNLAEQIEIVFGPASALYGANAVSGVINIITKKNASKDIHIEGSTVAGTYGYTNTSLFISKKINAHTSIIVSGQYSYDKGVDYSKLYKEDSSFNISSYATGTFNTIYGPATPAKPVRARYEAPLSAFNLYAALHMDNFSLVFFKNHFTVPTSYGSNTSNAIYNREAFATQSITTVSASYKKTFDKITSNTSLTASEYNLDPQSNFRNLYTAMEPAYKYSTCSMVKAEEQLDYKVSGRLDVTAGVEYESYYAIPQSADLDEPVTLKDYIHESYLGTEKYFLHDGLPAQFYFIRYHNAGTYFQAQYSPVSKIHITLGTRYDVNSRYGNTFNPRLGIVYEPSRKTSVKLLYGRAFLAPTSSDSYAQFGSFYTLDSGKTYHSNFLHLPNTGLKPITSKNSELNIRQYLNDNFYVTLDGYYTVLTGLQEFANDNNSTHLYNNMFNGIPVDYVEVYVNLDKQVNYGGSIHVNWKHTFGKIQANSSLSLSYINGYRLDVDKAEKDIQLDFIAPYMVHLATDLKMGKFSWSPRLIITGRQNINGTGDTTGIIVRRQTIAGYALLNMSMRYTLSKGFSVFANINNALNQHYRSVGYNMDLKKDTGAFHGQREDPIRIMGGINFTF